MSKNGTGIAAVIFKQDLARAETAFNQLAGMVKSQLIQLQTATTAQRDDKGKVSMGDTQDWTTGKRMRAGGFWGVLLGLAFAGPLIGLAAGLGLGAFLGKRKREEKKTKFVQELSDNMEPGDSAVFVSFDQLHRPDVLDMLKKMGGVMIADELSPEEEEALAAAIEKEETNAAIKEMKQQQYRSGADLSAEEGISNIQ